MCPIFDSRRDRASGATRTRLPGGDLPTFSAGDSKMGRIVRLLLSAAPLLASVAAAPAAAADLGAGFGINGGATVVSDYRFRGISQTNRRFAVQGTFSVSHTSGFY